MSTGTRMPWTLNEFEALETHYPPEGSKGAQQHIPYRTRCAIRAMAFKCKIRFSGRSLYSLWTPEEDALLAEKYPSMGKDVQTLLPNRTLTAIRARANKFSLRAPMAKTVRAWTMEEDAILRERYASEGGAVQAFLPTRSLSSIYAHAGKLNLSVSSKAMKTVSDKKKEHRNNAWTAEEDSILCKCYPSGGLAAVTCLLKRHSKSAIYSRASMYGIRRGAKSSDIEANTSPKMDVRKSASAVWSEKEDRILSTFYPTMGIRVQEKLPGRTETAIYSRAFEKNLNRLLRWTEAEDMFLRENYNVVSFSDIQKEFPHRSATSIRQRALLLGLTKKREPKVAISA